MIFIPCRTCGGDSVMYSGHPNDPDPPGRRCPDCRNGIEEVEGEMVTEDEVMLGAN